jgi:hypothetical protein
VDESEEPTLLTSEPIDKAYAFHPNGGMSFVADQTWGARAKRSAEPHYNGGYGYGGYGHHGYGARSYVGRTIWGFPGRYGHY